MCQRALYYLVNLDASQMTQLFEFLKRHCSLQVADRYGQNLRLPATPNGASSFKPAVSLEPRPAQPAGYIGLPTQILMSNACFKLPCMVRICWTTLGPWRTLFGDIDIGSRHMFTLRLEVLDPSDGTGSVADPSHRQGRCHCRAP